jgi:hypothetical protein
VPKSVSSSAAPHVNDNWQRSVLPLKVRRFAENSSVMRTKDLDHFAWSKYNQYD